jgi:hypothetical protein
MLIGGFQIRPPDRAPRVERKQLCAKRRYDPDIKSYRCEASLGQPQRWQRSASFNSNQMFDPVRDKIGNLRIIFASRSLCLPNKNR